jgi:hypothetical protein
LDDVGFFDENLKVGEDRDMWIRIAQKYDFDFVRELLIKRYIHPSNMSRTTNFEVIGENQDYLINKHRKIYEENPKIYSSVLRSEGTLYIFAGNVLKGGKYFLRAIQINPFDIRNYFYFFISLFGSKFYHKLSLLKRRLRQVL